MSVSFVYRYLDRHGTVRYVGRTDSIKTRYYQHSKDPVFKTWICEYIGDLTKTDAQMLESHLISVYKDSISNKIQLTHGPLTIADLHTLEWTPFPKPFQKAGRENLRQMKKPEKNQLEFLAEKCSELSERNKFLEEDNSYMELALIHAWATIDEYCETISERVKQFLTNRKTTRRIDLLRDMPAETLALYLKNELDDGVPTDWLAWLLEPEGSSNA